MAKTVNIKEILKSIFAIEVEDDAYRFDIITNKNLTRRYGHLEYALRSTGLDRRILLNPIEHYVYLFSTKEIVSNQLIITFMDKSNISWCEAFLLGMNIMKLDQSKNYAIVKKIK